MTKINPTIRTMTFDEARDYGHCNEGFMLDHGTVSYRLTATKYDDVHVLQSGPILYVLTINFWMEYVALDIYVPYEPEPVDSIFLQGDHGLRECIGNNWRDMPLMDAANNLILMFG